VEHQEKQDKRIRLTNSQRIRVAAKAKRLSRKMLEQCTELFTSDTIMRWFRELIAQKYKRYFDMVHSYGAKVMEHICGCCYDLLPRLIELGLDIYDVVQPTTPEMDIANLQKQFGDDLVFCGSMCVQTTLAWDKPEDVEREVKRRPDLFPKGGLFLGPTHAIQVGSLLENILALYRSAGSLCENIDDSILSIVDDEDQIDKINMSKLY